MQTPKLNLVEQAAEIKRLREAIERALADSESGTGWGPDITVCAYLREALEFRASSGNTKTRAGEA